MNLVSNQKVTTTLAFKNNVIGFINLHVLYRTGICSVESLYLLLTPMSKGLPLLQRENTQVYTEKSKSICEVERQRPIQLPKWNDPSQL